MEQEFTIEPLTLYQTFKLEPGKQIQDFTFGVNNTEIDYQEILSTYGESDLVRKFLTTGTQCGELFRELGIDYPNCWIGIELNKELLISNWPHSKPGDIDIIIGNFVKDSCIIDYHSTIAFQVKIRKIKNFDDLASPPSGYGTTQSMKTSEMGFPRTYLAHLVVREPRELQPNQSISWNVVNNASFSRAFSACHGKIRDKIQIAPYGYIVLGWGQAHGIDWRVSGAFSSKIIKEAPTINQLNNYQSELFESLSELFQQPRNQQRPLIIDGSMINT